MEQVKSGVHTRWVLGGLAAVLMIALFAASMQRLHNSLLSERVALLESRVQHAFIQISNYHRLSINGHISDQHARNSAIEYLRQMRFSDDEYFWVVDDSGQFLMNGARRDLEGQQVSGITDFEGPELAKRIDEVMQGLGRGLIYYGWPRANDDRVVEKVGYIQRFAPWGWGVGSGVYTDDIDAIFWDEAANLAIISLVLLAVLIFFWFGFERSLFYDHRAQPPR